jgi:ATP-dependent Zn protease
LAGIEAERLFCGELLARTAHDIQAARAIAALIVRSVSDIDSYIDLARTETRGLLTVHAAAVLVIADALVEHRTISGEQIAELI